MWKWRWPGVKARLKNTAEICSERVKEPVRWLVDQICRLYIFEDRTKLPYILAHLQGVKLSPYSQVKSDLKKLTASCGDGKIWISEQSSHSLVQLVPKSKLCSSPSPIQLLKAVKNDTEIQGMKACQVNGRKIFFPVKFSTVYGTLRTRLMDFVVFISWVDKFMGITLTVGPTCFYGWFLLDQRFSCPLWVLVLAGARGMH